MAETPEIPWRPLEVCACTGVRRAARAVTQLYDLVLAPTGLKATQFVSLLAIAHHGEVAQWRLAEEYAIAVETLSRRLGALRRNGLIAARRGEHRSERLYRLTPEGKTMLRKALPYWERAQRRLQEELGSDWGLLHGFSDRLTAAACRAQTARKRNKST